ncbi:Bug family tripartite tricarboxylate transporter substrate binding protein [Pararoseomonas indoligenes]|uniref:Tripartite tricarboxylate transporter substrate binding protein n=1 Tax=Roseomonas indoligenes TaxID=2820811 RepID=A0A940S2I8_9PROT|nr:tripartite tricarboxylate transporter substrate binding protein [Pararoseomonas indoligenes]MBP0491171.1 tripartite tricarboxylate transporter substrate binding protein [Pararoseomonas indoligenes]
MTTRRTLLALAGAAPLAPALAPFPARAQAEAWPARPVTVLVPFVAGGPSDIVARAAANRMGQAIGQPVVVENRPGANGEVAARVAMRAAPDGHTLMVGSIGVWAINAALRPNLGYDPLKDFTPLVLAVTTPNVLVVNRDHPARDVAGLIQWLKEAGGRAAYSTSGVGSSDQLTTELFKLRTGTEITHIPYTGGAAAATDLIAGNVSLSFQNLGTVAGHIEGGRLRALMVTSDRPHPVLPGVPTAEQAGLRDFVVTSWQSFMAPAGMSGPLRDRVAAALRDSLLHAETRSALERIGFDVVPGTPEQYRRFQEAEIARWREVIRAARIVAS